MNEQSLFGLNTRPSKKGFAAFIRRMISPERGFYQVCIIYGIAVSLTSLAVPVAVQMVINTVANTAQQLSLFVVCGLVVLMLTVAALLYALQIYTMELFCRRFFARNVAEIAIVLTDAVAAGWRRANAYELIKRYYEVIAAQKAIPNLIISGFSMGLQMLVGLVVVAFYHPFLLAFNLVFVMLCLLVWRIWHISARESARRLSEAKYTMAGWLGTFAHEADQFSGNHVIEALTKTNALTNDYIDARRAFFQCSFAQNLGFLLLYIMASAGLLGLGGWLVIAQQLTLGQLAAAEIILSAVFFNLTRIGYFLRLYYEVCVSSEKLDSLFVDPVTALAMEKTR